MRLAKRWLATASTPYKPVLTMQTMNPKVKSADYAVRGEIAIQAERLRQQLESDSSAAGLPFDRITQCNIGNPQQLGQQPITFFRQVAALVEYPPLLEQSNLFPKDAIRRARSLLQSCNGQIGAYSHSQGIPAVRQHVAEFIQKRDDGCVAHADDIFLTAGASQGVQFVLQSLAKSEQTGIMIPIPQYPLYTATLSLLDCRPVPYYLDEASGWSLSIGELERAIGKAREQGTDVRALCVINPGNPTGNCLAEGNMEEIVRFCHQHRLMLLADEVYQTNVYSDNKPFHSFKKVIRKLKSPIELVSFHSISKGVVGECGRRGGYFEVTNMDQEVCAELYKLASIGLCPPVQGQLLVDMMVKPPQSGDESFSLYQQEVDAIYTSLKRRALKLAAAFNSMTGVSCQQAEGAMYLFPAVKLPPKAVEQAQKLKKAPDAFYVMEMLKATGVVCVPGSGFGQKPGTFHFRATFLPPEHVFDEFIGRLSKFHEEFMRKYQ